MTHSATLLAETQQPAAGGTAWFLPVMLLIIALLFWSSMRRQKKAQAAIKAKQATMGPGTRVMTNFGLYGTVRSIDREQNMAELEVSPGTTVTVHTQTLTTVLEDTVAEADHAADGATSRAATAPSDTTGTTARTTDKGSTTAGRTDNHGLDDPEDLTREGHRPEGTH